MSSKNTQKAIKNSPPLASQTTPTPTTGTLPNSSVTSVIASAKTCSSSVSPRQPQATPSFITSSPQVIYNKSPSSSSLSSSSSSSPARQYIYPFPQQGSSSHIQPPTPYMAPGTVTQYYQSNITKYQEHKKKKPQASYHNHHHHHGHSTSSGRHHHNHHHHHHHHHHSTSNSRSRHSHHSRRHASSSKTTTSHSPLDDEDIIDDKPSTTNGKSDKSSKSTKKSDKFESDSSDDKKADNSSYGDNDSEDDGSGFNTIDLTYGGAATQLKSPLHHSLTMGSLASTQRLGRNIAESDRKRVSKHGDRRNHSPNHHNKSSRRHRHKDKHKQHRRKDHGYGHNHHKSHKKRHRKTSRASKASTEGCKVKVHDLRDSEGSFDEKEIPLQSPSLVTQTISTNVIIPQRGRRSSQNLNTTNTANNDEDDSKRKQKGLVMLTLTPQSSSSSSSSQQKQSQQKQHLHLPSQDRNSESSSSGGGISTARASTPSIESPLPGTPPQSFALNTSLSRSSGAGTEDRDYSESSMSASASPTFDKMGKDKKLTRFWRLNKLLGFLSPVFTGYKQRSNETSPSNSPKQLTPPSKSADVKATAVPRLSSTTPTPPPQPVPISTFGRKSKKDIQPNFSSSIVLTVNPKTGNNNNTVTNNNISNIISNNSNNNNNNNKVINLNSLSNVNEGCCENCSNGCAKCEHRRNKSIAVESPHDYPSITDLTKMKTMNQTSPKSEPEQDAVANIKAVPILLGSTVSLSENRNKSFTDGKKVVKKAAGPELPKRSRSSSTSSSSRSTSISFSLSSSRTSSEYSSSSSSASASSRGSATVSTTTSISSRSSYNSKSFSSSLPSSRSLESSFSSTFSTSSSESSSSSYGRQAAKAKKHLSRKASSKHRHTPKGSKKLNKVDLEDYTNPMFSELDVYVTSIAKRDPKSKSKSKSKSPVKNAEKAGKNAGKTADANEAKMAKRTKSQKSIKLSKSPKTTLKKDAVNEEVDTYKYVFEIDENYNPYPYIQRICSVPRPPVTKKNILGKKASDAPKITLVLDLDETLVHCTTERTPQPAITFSVNWNGGTYFVSAMERPYLQEFMKEVSKLFEVVIFTASQKVYANKLLDIIDPEFKWSKKRLFRESCAFIEGNYIKDLEVLGRDMSKIVIIDNSPQAFALQYDNALPISSWFDDSNDMELAKVLPLLRKLAVADDVRPILRKRFKLYKKIEF